MRSRSRQVAKTAAVAVDRGGAAVVVSPYPAPELVRQYAEIQPDAADRILKVVEREQEADLALARREEAHDFALKAIGMVSATLLCLGALAGGVLLILRGAVASGWASLVGSLVVVFSIIAAGGRRR